MPMPICPKQGVPFADIEGRLFGKTWWLFFYNLSVSLGLAPELLQGLHADRFPAVEHTNAVYIETDRGVTYVSRLVSGVYQWVYLSGQYVATLASLPADLGVNDAGFLFGASDYFHEYRWSGSAWGFAPGDPGSKYIVGGIAAPLGGLWGLCDGTTYAVAQAAGTTTNVVSPDMRGDIFVQGVTSYTGTRQAAARATWEGSAKTADENTHTHPLNLPASASYGAGAFGAYPGGLSTTGPGDAHSHALTDALSQLKVPSESNGGLPLRIGLLWYMRR